MDLGHCCSCAAGGRVPWFCSAIGIGAGAAAYGLRYSYIRGGDPCRAFDRWQHVGLCFTGAANRRRHHLCTHRWPIFLPDGEHFLFWAGDFNESPDDHHTGIYFSSFGGKQKTLITPARSSVGCSQGRILFRDEKHSLVAAPIDISTGKLLGGRREAPASVVNWHSHGPVR